MTWRRVLAVIAIMIGCVLNPLNGSLAITAYPRLSEFFQVPYAHMSAMVMYFMAITAAGQPLAGGLGDFLGRKNIFLAGILGFTISSAMAANAQTFDALLWWRVGQAAFSGIIMPNGMALIAQVAPREKIGGFVGLLNSAFVATTVVGFVLGGFLVHAFDWPVLFHLNVVLGAAAFVLAAFCIPKDTGSKAGFTALSFIGVPFLPLALGLQALVQGTAFIPYFLIFLLLLAALAWRVFHSSDSRTQLKSFSNRRFHFSCLILFFSIAQHFSIMFTLPAWANSALGINSGWMGLYFAIIAGAQVLTSILFGKIIDTHGDRLLRWFAACAIAAPALIMIFYLNRISFALALALFGTGLAAAQLIAQRASLLSSSEQSRALAMGIFSSYRSIGGLSGNALAAVVLASYTVVVPQAGVHVFEWGLGLFALPLMLALWGLNANNHTVSRSTSS